MITNRLLKNTSNLAVKNNFDISSNKLFGVIITKKNISKSCNIIVMIIVFQALPL